jgi:hypothetical protein
MAELLQLVRDNHAESQLCLGDELPNQDEKVDDHLHNHESTQMADYL